MVDERIKKLADILVNYSIKVNKGDVIVISFGVDAAGLALECFKLVLQKGAKPLAKPYLPRFGHAYYKHAPDEVLQAFPKIAMFEAENVQGHIQIDVDYNTREMSNIDPKKMTMRRKSSEKVSNFIVNQDNWILCGYPTSAMAQEAEMSLEEYEAFFFDAVLADWEAASKKQNVLEKVMNEGKEVHITGEGTDLRFSIAGKKAKKCDGHRNMPDGEVFTEPVKNSVNGTIVYDFPCVYSGRVVEGVKLVFKDGKVIEATATKNEEFLKEMLAMDEGASYLGEFGVGVNFGIQNFTKDILFDEKIGGTIHLALGRSYEETGGENKSALHWDMIKDLRKKGKLLIDGKVIQKDGKFQIEM